MSLRFITDEELDRGSRCESGIHYVHQTVMPPHLPFPFSLHTHFLTPALNLYYCIQYVFLSKCYFKSSSCSLIYSISLYSSAPPLSPPHPLLILHLILSATPFSPPPPPPPNHSPAILPGHLCHLSLILPATITCTWPTNALHHSPLFPLPIPLL